MTWIPRSDVMGARTPNLEIQPATKASVQAVAVVEVKGTVHITSIHLVVLSMMVITCVWLS